MLTLTATAEWKESYPSATIGLLEISALDNHQASPELERRKREEETRLRERYRGYERRAFLAIPAMTAYQQYYKRFAKTYHVLLQLESIALKGKSLPIVSPIVDANFLAEVETLVLTAAHDVARLREPICIDVARAGDHLTPMVGARKDVPATDMVMRDAGGICCSILYGQDNRSPISPDTTRVLYVSYAPAGIQASLVDSHLRAVEENVRLFSQSARVEQRRMLSA